jgi:S1-C subfamily serine protease
MRALFLLLLMTVSVACGGPPNITIVVPRVPGIATAHGQISRTVKVFSDCPNGDTSTGSGVIVSSTGLLSDVLTAKHVIEPACNFTVRGIDGVKALAYLVKKSPKHDIALLRVFRGYDLANVRYGIPALGDTVTAVGYPYDLREGKTVLTVTRGTLAANYGGTFRMTAQVLPGSSGGPAFGSQGELLGVVVSYLPYTGTRLAYDGHYYVVPVSMLE